jgi:anti-anti-sigma factor
MAMELKVINADGAYTHIALSGKLDILGVGEIEDQFIGHTAGRKKNALVDISGVTLTGSMGLRLFLRASRSLSADKKSLILLNPQPLVNEVLEESGIRRVIDVEHNTESALNKAMA